MAAATNARDKKDKDRKDNTAEEPPVEETGLVPPEEEFWKHYSPHGEAPISLAGSVALHLLAFGVLVLFAVWLAALFIRGDRSLPIEPVRLNLGGGGGKKSGVGDAPGVGTGPVEDAGTEDVPVPALNDTAPKLPKLDAAAQKALEQKFDPADARIIADSNNDQARKLAKLEDNIRRKLSDGLRPGKGQGGPGSGGGKDRGKGKGEGAGEGEGKAKLSQREKRMLRWHMRFTASTGPEYLAQLRSLGAILAIPTREGPNPEYKIVRDLKPGAKLLDEDLDKINRIYWIDDKPNSVRDIMAALGLNMNPSRFVAFMPEQLEADLFNMERSYVEKVLRVKFDEDKIDETHFKVVHKGGSFKPELLSVSMRRR